MQPTKHIKVRHGLRELGLETMLIIYTILCFVQVVIANAKRKMVEIVSRADWGAQKAVSTASLTSPVTYVFIHHTAGAPSKDLASGKKIVQGIQKFHMDEKGWDDIGYSFLIGTDGTIFEGRGWKNIGAHTVGYNNKGYGISFLGNFTDVLPSEKAVSSAKALITDAVTNGYLTSSYILKGHRQITATECPGTKLFEEIKTWSNFAA